MIKNLLILSLLLVGCDSSKVVYRSAVEEVEVDELVGSKVLKSGDCILGVVNVEQIPDQRYKVEARRVYMKNSDGTLAFLGNLSAKKVNRTGTSIVYTMTRKFKRHDNVRLGRWIVRGKRTVVVSISRSRMRVKILAPLPVEFSAELGDE